MLFRSELSQGVNIDVATGFTSSNFLLAPSKIQQGLRNTKVLSTDKTTLSGLSMKAFLLGAENADLFIGAGPYFVDSNQDGVIDSSDTPSTDAVGFQITNLDLGLGIFQTTKDSDPDKVIPKLFAMKAFADSAGEVGLDVFDLEATGIEVLLNQGSVYKGQTGTNKIAPYLDFSTLQAGGLSIETGGSSQFLDFSESFLGLKAANAIIKIDEFVYIEGGFLFQKGAKKKVNVKTGVNLLTGAPLIPTFTELQLKTDAVVSAD